MDPPPLLMVPCARCAIFIPWRSADFTPDGEPVCARCSAALDLDATLARAKLEEEAKRLSLLEDGADGIAIVGGVIAFVGELLP